VWSSGTVALLPPSADQRYYASAYGRFNTADRLASSAMAGDPGSWNRYAYVGGDPVNRKDPKGLCSQDIDYNWWDDDEVPEGDFSGVMYPGNCTDSPVWVSWANSMAPGSVSLNGSPYYPGGDDGADDADSTGVPGPAGNWLIIAQELWAAYQTDLTALEKPKCADLFGAKSGIDPYALLTDLFYGIGNRGSITIGDIPPSGPNLVTSANTTPGVSSNSQTGQTSNTAYILINDLAGVFVNGTASFPATAQNQAITLLHELGHAVWDIFGGGSSQIKPDHNKPGTSLDNTWKVKRKCF